jgi:hypothetical protein
MMSNNWKYNFLFNEILCKTIHRNKMGKKHLTVVTTEQ